MPMSKQEVDDYYARKEAGDCVRPGCPNKAGDTVMCDQHAKHYRKVKVRSQARPRVKAKQKKAAKRWRKDRIALGQCISCSEPVVTKTQCRRHQLENVDYYQQHSTKPKSTQRCSLCREPGHRAPTCSRAIADVVPVRLEDLARSRHAVEAG